MPERENSSLSLSHHLRLLGLAFVFGGSLQTLAAAYWGLTHLDGRAPNEILILFFLLAGVFAIGLGQRFCATARRLDLCTGCEEQVSAAGRLLGGAGQAALCIAGGLCLLVIQAVLLPAATQPDGALTLLMR
ncbi:MAG: hypothetical protein HY319_06835 [Armatimonadetes bacterium]|nr:hypothetical protein [Armatimonadota bacterium]